MIMKPMNNQRSKLGNIPQVKDGIRFDSKWELKVFETIVSVFGKDKFSVHEKVLIKPPTKHYKASYWKCDFIVGRGSNLLYIDAKGMITRDFKRQMQMLDIYSHNIVSNVRIVTQVPVRVDEYIKSISLDDLKKELIFLKSQIKHIYGEA